MAEYQSSNIDPRMAQTTTIGGPQNRSLQQVMQRMVPNQGQFNGNPRGASNMPRQGYMERAQNTAYGQQSFPQMNQYQGGQQAGYGRYVPPTMVQGGSQGFNSNQWNQQGGAGGGGYQYNLPNSYGGPGYQTMNYGQFPSFGQMSGNMPGGGFGSPFGQGGTPGGFSGGGNNQLSSMMQQLQNYFNTQGQRLGNATNQQYQNQQTSSGVGQIGPQQPGQMGPYPSTQQPNINGPDTFDTQGGRYTIGPGGIMMENPAWRGGQQALQTGPQQPPGGTLGNPGPLGQVGPQPLPSPSSGGIGGSGHGMGVGSAGGGGVQGMGGRNSFENVLRGMSWR